MPTATEAATQSTQMHAALNAGINTVSNFQQLTFDKYVRLILPMDGFVFWAKASLLVDTMLFSAYRFNAAALKEVTQSAFSGNQVIARDVDVHYSTQNTQNEENADVINKVVVTSATLIEGLQEVGPYVMYLATIDGIRFSFSSRGFLQQNANIYHYAGNAVYASMATQVIDDPNDLDVENVVVSNSLPIWLSFNYYNNQPWEPFGNKTMPLYPSYLIPNNLPPPFAAVHIIPESTQVLTGAPYLGPMYQHLQLTKERVKITLYGERNGDAQDFVDFVLQQSMNYEQFGIMNMPTLRDEKKTQVELGTIAIKKSIEFEINYYQTRIRDIARELILHCTPTLYVEDYGPIS